MSAPPVLLSGSAACLAIVASAVAPFAVAQEDSGVVQREAVRVVRLSILAVDRGGKPTPDVSAETLEVDIAGHTLRIAGLAPATVEPGVARDAVEPDGPLPRDDLPDARLQIELGNDITTRRATTSEPRYWTVFIDIDNDVPADAAFEAAIAEFVKSTLRPGAFVCIVSYGGTLRVEQNFTTDLTRVAAAVEAAFQRTRTSGLATHDRVNSLMRSLSDCERLPDPPAEAARQESPDSITPDRDILGNVTRPGEAEMGCIAHKAHAYVEEARFRSDRYFQALEHGVRFAAGMPGVPTILAISHGVTIQPQSEYVDAVRAVYGDGPLDATGDALLDHGSAREALDRVRELARDEGVSLYFIDPSTRKGIVRGVRQERLYESSVDPISTAWSAPRRDLTQLAEATGGSFAADIDVAPALRAALEREEARLALDVYVPEDMGIEELQKIRVRSREKDIEIVGTRLEVWPSVPPELRVQGSVKLAPQKPRSAGRKGATQIFLIGVPLREMDYERGGGAMIADFTLAVRIETADGRHLIDSPHVFRHTFPLDKWEASEGSDLAVRGFLEAPPGEYKMIVEFRNTRTRKTGVIEQDIHIP